MKLPPSQLRTTYSTILRNLNERESAVPARDGTDDPQWKRLNQMQDGLIRLKAMPSPKAQASQATARRVAMLKQRLEELKAMLLHATPEQAKAQARELKSIARQLSSAAKAAVIASESSSTPSATPGISYAAGVDQSVNASDANSQAGAAEVSESASRAVSAVDASDDKGPDGSRNTDETKGGGTPSFATSAPPTPGCDSEGPEGDDGKALRLALADARRLLKQVIAMIKSKLAAGDREARRDLESAEKSLAEMDEALAQGDGNALYTAVGNLDAVSASAIPAVASGGGECIDVAV